MEGAVAPTAPSSLLRPGKMFVNPLFDHLLIGGIVSWVAGGIIYGAGVRYNEADLFWVLLVSNWAHFAASTVRLYTKPDAVRTWPFLTLAFPVVTIAVVSAVVALGEPAGRYFFALYFLWSPFHYSAQAYGLSVMYAYRSGTTLAPMDRTLIRWTCLLPFFWTLLQPQGGLGLGVLRGLPAARGAEPDPDRALAGRAHRRLPLAPETARHHATRHQPRGDLLQCHLVDGLQLVRRLHLGHRLPRPPVPRHRARLPHQGSGAARRQRARLALPRGVLLRHLPRPRLRALPELAAALLAGGLRHRAGHVAGGGGHQHPPLHRGCLHLEAAPGSQLQERGRRPRFRGRSLNRLERNRERAQAPQGQALAVLGRVRGQGQLRHPLQQRIDGDLPLDAREGGAEAEVNSPAEGDVTIVRARDVETVGVGKLGRVTVGGPDEGQDQLAFADRAAADGDVFARNARGTLHGAVVP